MRSTWNSPPCPHQSWLLHNLGLVTGTRSDRGIVYSLYDNHVAQLLDEAVYHSERLRLGYRIDRTRSVIRSSPVRCSGHLALGVADE